MQCKVCVLCVPDQGFSDVIRCSTGEYSHKHIILSTQLILNSSLVITHVQKPFTVADFFFWSVTSLVQNLQVKKLGSWGCYLHAGVVTEYLLARVTPNSWVRMRAEELVTEKGMVCQSPRQWANALRKICTWLLPWADSSNKCFAMHKPRHI